MIFLGVFDRVVSEFSPEETRAFQQVVSRDADDTLSVIAIPNFIFISVDDQIFNQSFKVDLKDGCFRFLSGRSYLSEHGIEEDIQLTCDALRTGNYSDLKYGRGSFCAGIYDFEASALKLCSDKVGVFPIYIAEIEGRVYFSSALRILTALRMIPKDLDLDGTFENIAFGYCLRRDTPYANMKRMYGGEIVEFNARSQNNALIESYWSWSAIPLLYMDREDFLGLFHQQFLKAVQIRLDNGSEELSFLSGGLDSRCIAAALVELDKAVVTLNFAPEGSQDHLFGRMVGEVLGTTHFELGLNQGSFPERQRTILDSWRSENIEQAGLASPYRVWSGDGGSVGVGHVYLDETFIGLLRNGQDDEACNYFIKKRKHFVPVRGLNKSLRGIAASVPRAVMLEELRSFQCDDLGKSGFLFLLLNDQRHHLAGYFEDLDLCRFELVLPFFDAELIALILSAPLDWFLRHKFYNAWLKQFQSGVSLIPWQAYPDHEPCPLPLDGLGPLRYQWEEDWFDEVEVVRRRLSTLVEWEEMLRSDAFPHRLLERSGLVVAFWLTKFGIRDYGYLLDAARKIRILVKNVN